MASRGVGGYSREPLWYKDAIIYELHVRAFFDSNGDGVGDFRGLTEKLDYLVDLGVTAIWLLPFYPSPLRDDGYDIADYYAINETFGTIQDFKRLLVEAHARGLKVITELVLNHTSDQHEWFKRSRRAGKDSPWRDFYVWSDKADKYKEARIIFRDFERSNWTYDPVANRYFWHRFYSHQPDLNFDNPLVRKKLLEVMDFWFGMGVDGLRLDAIPYLYEREGTSCENLPDTHGYIRSLRKHVDKKWPNRMLLAEANQWPEDAVEYFGAGDECHMCFHFPLMPRLFMALRLENRFSIIDILQQTPKIPDNCQWALFLRNHDELTLEMVTDEERDYMYKVYSQNPRARINLGIRRRLAPLLANDRRQIELLNVLLFSLPGTPVIYYGDEIGMGDNMHLGDRDGVRTPFQWSPDRNAGFSKADSSQLFLPVVASPEYSFHVVNVETQDREPSSLLRWTKILLSIRKRYPVLSRGELNFLDPENSRILAFVRELGDDAVLVVANLSASTQGVELDLHAHKGKCPVDAFGGEKFPVIGDSTYFLSLPPYAYFMLELRAVGDRTVRRPTLITANTRVEFTGDPARLVRNRSVLRRLEEALPQYLLNTRWFAGRGRRIDHCSIDDMIPLEFRRDSSASFFAAVASVFYDDDDAEQYFLTLGYTEGALAERLIAENPGAVILENMGRRHTQNRGILFDALIQREFSQMVLDSLLRLQQHDGETSVITSSHLIPKRQIPKELPEPSVRRFEQNNTSILFEQKYFLKVYRRLEEGENPEVEFGRYFLRNPSPDTVAHFLGCTSLKARGKRVYTLATLHEFVPNVGDAWQMLQNLLSSYTGIVLGQDPSSLPENVGTMDVIEFMRADSDGRLLFADFDLNFADILGRRIGSLHRVLAADETDPLFAPEEMTPFHQRSLQQSIRNAIVRTLTELRTTELSSLPEVKEAQKVVSGARNRMMAFVEKLGTFRVTSKRIRCHGDLDLTQVLFTGKDFVVLDFEGLPTRSIGERRLKRQPLLDVAAMLLSIDYATQDFLHQNQVRTEDVQKLTPWLDLWRLSVSAAFLKAYQKELAGHGVLTGGQSEFDLTLRLLLLERILNQIVNELDNRVDWLPIPMRSLERLLLVI